MLNKEQIINIIQKCKFDSSQYWVITGAAMVLYDLRNQAGNIDIGCTSKMADKLQLLGYPTKILEDGSRHIRYNDDIEIFERWGEGNSIIINGIPVITIDELIRMKYQIGRDKDLNDINIIKEKYESIGNANKIQSVFLTSNPMNLENNRINNKNGLIKRLKIVLPCNSKVLFVCSNPNSYESTDKYANILFDCFVQSGFEFADFKILDGRNEGNSSKLVFEADFILLMGGHVPTQNDFFNRIDLKKLLLKSKATVLGFSAGSMNMAEIVYAQPDLEGEAVSKEYKRFIQGLGITKTMIIPHYQKIRNELLDGMRIFEDITYPDSIGREFIALVDGSYIEIYDHKEKIYGESYLIKNGDITKLCEDGESKQLYKS